MLQQFFKTKDYSTLSSISQAYETNQDTKKAVHANIAQIVKVLGHDSSLDYQILSLLHQVAKKEPFLLEKHISKIEKYITHAHHFSQALMILGLIANAKPTLFKGKGNNYCTIENTAMVTMQLFLPIAHISDSEAERMIKVTEKEIQKEIKTDGSAGMMPNS
uniref:Uncharacterized protein n=1 Tax=Plectus sambesii TaxID=2011161 RepID=A0A914VE71_9BILA